MLAATLRSQTSLRRGPRLRRATVRGAVPPAGLRRISLAWVAPAIALLAATAAAQDAPAAADAAMADPAAERVIVQGFDGSFPELLAAIEKAKAESGREYRVVVVGDAKGGNGAARRLLEQLIERWRQLGRGKAGGFDPSRDVMVVLDVQDRQIVMKVPVGLEESLGLDPGTIKEELIDRSFVPRAVDGKYDEGLAGLVTATELWVKNREEQKKLRAAAREKFRTRTVPMAVAALTGLGLLTTFLLVRARHARRLAEAKRKLAAFKGEVVALSDLLDAQQERHRMLPHSDPDFKTPMQGMTRSAYDNVQGALRRYRERWLGLMDVWERAEAKIAKESFLGTSAADEAIALLDSAEARPPLADVNGECSAPLDALEQAHEKAREAAAGLGDAVGAATGRLARLTERGRSAAAFQGPLADVSRGLELARHDVESDPVAARGRLEEHATALARLDERIEALEAVDDHRAKAGERTGEIAKQVQAKRAEGWLLTEPGANPDEHLASGRAEAVLAAQLLDAGETAAAQTHVERADKANADAATLLENIVAAKAKIDDLLPACAARLEALESRRGQAVRAVEQIAGMYADSSWSDIVDNVARADDGIARARTLLAEARAAADHSRQHYFRAVALLEETVRQEDWVEGLFAAIHDRRAELDGLRASLPKRHDAVSQRVGQLATMLERQHTDRVRANERAREAGRLVEAAERGFRIERPDLRQVGQVLEAADTAAARGEELAREDERLARQAFEDLQETDDLVRRVAAWYSEGVSADVQPSVALLETAKSQLTRQRYEDSLKASGEAARLAKEAYAAATAEGERRRRRRMAQVQQRQLEDSFSRMSRGFGPWVIQLPGGTFSGPDPWRTMHGPSGGMSGGASGGSSVSRSAGSGWSSHTAESSW